jgi:hypothetical protein
MTRTLSLLGLLALLGSGTAAAQRTAAAQPAQAPTSFRHSVHRDVACSGCHSSSVRHGAVILRGQEDCQRCHHQGVNREACAECHAPASIRRAAPAPRTFVIAASNTTITLRMRFDHQQHGRVACTTCHGNTLTREPDKADCASCHAQHHSPTADCTTCHQGGQILAAHTADQHATCGTAACHGARAERMPSSREACLVCHRAQREHVPGRLCVNCHPVRGTP